MISLLLALFVLLQVLDWLLTRRLLLADVAHEANPVTAFFIQHLGLDRGILVLKAIAVVLVCAFLWDHPILLLILCLCYVGIVVWNYRLVRSKVPT